MIRFAAVGLMALTLTSACGSDSAYVGKDPAIVWWTDYESGDLSAWAAQNSKIWTANDGAASVVTSPVRSGRYAMRSIANSGDPNVISAAIGVREALTPELATQPVSASPFVGRGGERDRLLRLWSDVDRWPSFVE